MGYLPLFEQVAEHQSAQGARAYAIQDQLDSRATDAIAHSMSTGSVDMTATQIKSAMTHRITSCTVAGRVLTIPASDGRMQGPLVIESDAANTQSCEVRKLPARFVIAPGERRFFWNWDDDDGDLTEIASGGGGSVIVPTSRRKTFSGARVKHSATQTISQSNFTKLAFNQELFDVGGWHDTVTNNQRLTVPSGVTKVRVFLANYSNNNPVQFAGIGYYIVKNGTEIVYDYRAPFWDNTANGQPLATPPMDVVAGDYFEAYVCFWESTSTLALTTGNFNSFAIWAVDEPAYGAVPIREIVTDYIAGTPAASSLVYREVVPNDVVLLPDFAGAAAHCGTNPSGATAFDVRQQGSSIGSVSFSTGGVPTFSTTSSDPITIAAGQRFDIVAPGALNGIADLAFGFRGYHA